MNQLRRNTTTPVLENYIKRNNSVFADAPVYGIPVHIKNTVAAVIRASWTALKGSPTTSSLRLKYDDGSSPTHRRKTTALAALRVVTKVISNVSQEWLEHVASGKATLMLVRTEERKPKENLLSPSRRRGALDYARLRDDLRAVESSEGQDLLFCVKPNSLAPNLSAYLVN